MPKYAEGTGWRGVANGATAGVRLASSIQSVPASYAWSKTPAVPPATRPEMVTGVQSWPTRTSRLA
jgi:hypothetical protein